MAENKKITEADLLAIVEPGKTLLSWLKVSRPENAPENVRELEIISNQKKRGRKKKYTFEVVPKLANTPKAVRKDRRAAEAALAGEEDYYKNKLFIYPYLYPKSQRVLAGIKKERGEDEEVREGEEVSWVDLSGNGVVVVPGSLYVKSLVNYNKNPQSRVLVNPYSGRSALIGRLLIEQQQWPTSKAIVEGVAARGASISPAQVAKAVKAYEEDLIVAKKGGEILLKNPSKLLDELGSAYKPTDAMSVALRLPERVDWVSAVAQLKGFDWAVTGESSVTRYTAFAQGGAIRIAVTDLAKAKAQLGGKLESVPNFTDVVLIGTNQPEYYFQNEVDEQGVRWASPIQTWLELQAGDARQQEAAAEIRRKGIEKVLTPEEIKEMGREFAPEAKREAAKKKRTAQATLDELEAEEAAPPAEAAPSLWGGEAREVTLGARKLARKLREKGIVLSKELQEVPSVDNVIRSTDVIAYVKTLAAAEAAPVEPAPAEKPISAPEVADESEEKQK